MCSLRDTSITFACHQFIYFKCQTSFWMTNKASILRVYEGFHQRRRIASTRFLIPGKLRSGVAPTLNNLVEKTKETRTWSKMVHRNAELIKPCLKLEGEIVKGFGRGSKEIGCPTANFSEEVVDRNIPETLPTGVYLGWTRLNGDVEMVEKAVISIGWNPFYGNEKKSVETHIIKQIHSDLYGRCLKLLICGYIRPELNFDSLEDLTAAINDDIKFADSQLETNALFNEFKDDEFLRTKT